MAVLPILTIDQPVLRQKAKKVSRVDAGTQRLLDDMVDTMLDAPGVGLAGPQVGVALRVIVVKADEHLHCLVNPEIIRAEGEQTGYEGCLSYPGFIGEVTRADSVVVKGRNRQGREVKIKADGFVARAFQHEVDHLDGIIFIDRLTRLESLKRVEDLEEVEDESQLEVVGA